MHRRSSVHRVPSTSTSIRRVALLAVLLLGCEQQERDLVRDLPADETYASMSLMREAHVVRTEANVPHIYASTRHDAAYVLGFTTARDRYFMMDLARRLGTGTISELLGDVALSSDLQSRLTGITTVADQMAAQLDDVVADHVDAYVAGVNDYIAAVKAGTFALPSELGIAAPLLGLTSPADLMAPFSRRDLCAIAAVTVYQSSFDTTDIRHAAIAASLPTAFDGVTDEAYRKAGLDKDLYSPVAPLFPVASAPGLGTSGTPLLSRNATLPGISTSLVVRANAAANAMQVRFHRDRDAGYGSNAWAVGASSTKDGHALVAGDGHLSLSIPSVLYQFGIDTAVFGGGDLHQLGLTIPGFPLLAIGTNGNVAWSQTQLGDDITDWFREVILVDDDGYPSATLWKGQWMPVVRTNETYVVANVPALGSAGGTVIEPRFTTFDGRMLADFEGRVLASGETASSVFGLSGHIVIGDEDGDGKVTALSFSYAGLAAAQLLTSTDALGHANDIEDFRQATKGLVGYSQNFAVADSSGNVLYTSYEPIPCRSNLPRNPDGSFVAGADPTLLLDGTTYGAWTIPISDHVVDEAIGATDPAQCVVPFALVPQSINPAQGYVVTANNDPGGLSFDGSIFDDAVYLGGPWDEGYRADTISNALAAQVATKTASIDGMAQVQANHVSKLGTLFVPDLLAAIASAKTSTNPRIVTMYAADAAAYDEVATRLAGWRDRGYEAKSGVETFYEHPSAQDLADAVPTMLFNAWLRRFASRVLDDEPIADILAYLGTEIEVRFLVQLLRGRGDAGQAQLASWVPARKESVFFDDLRSPDIIETSDEQIIRAMADALAFLRSPSGFSSNDMSTWLWGLQHQVEFKSLIADYITDNAALAIITDQLEISTDVLPLGNGLAPSDPRAALRWFPRDGDQYNVDAANPGISGDAFTYASGPVMRMVFELANGSVSGRNIIPGGESGLIDSPHYADQARLWLGDDAYPVRFDVSSVVAGATRHEVFSPQ